MLPTQNPYPNSLTLNADGSLSRSSLAQNTDFNEVFTRWEPLGYPVTKRLGPDHYWRRYRRDPYARTIVRKPPRDTWSEPPEVVDDGGEDGGQTQFEEDVAEMFDGDHTRRSLLHRLFVVDVLARLGEYAALFIGYADVESVAAEVPEGAKDGPEDVVFFAAYPQDRVDFDIDTDLASERYGLPDVYDIDADPEGSDDADGNSLGTQTVHHSRVIHVAEETEEDDLRGHPALMTVWNRLEDLDKLLGGGAEMFWRGAYPGLVVKQDPDYRMADDGEGLADQIREYRQQMRRTMFPVGADIETLDGTTADPSGHIPHHIDGLSADSRIPQNMLTGNELGERATTEDRSTYHEFIRNRRQTYAEPVLLRPTLWALINAGAVAEPEGDGFDINWPTLDEPTEQEEAETAKAWAAAIKALTAGKPGRLGTMEEFRDKILEWDPEVGSEVDLEDVEAMAPVDESDPAAQDQFDQQQGTPGDDPGANEGDQPVAPDGGAEE